MQSELIYDAFLIALKPEHLFLKKKNIGHWQRIKLLAFDLNFGEQMTIIHLTLNKSGKILKTFLNSNNEEISTHFCHITETQNTRIYRLNIHFALETTQHHHIPRDLQTN